MSAKSQEEELCVMRGECESCSDDETVGVIERVVQLLVFDF